MELSWSTFILEIINFLVLVWILKRFLYRPVLEVIERRKSGIEKVRADAEATRAEAEKLQQQYDSRLADWNRERQQAREDLHSELEAARAQQVAQCQREIEQLRERARVADASREAEARQALEHTALLQGAQFATRLLETTAGRETQDGIVEMVVNELSAVTGERIAAIRNSCEQAGMEILVSSAYPLGEDQRERLQRALQHVAGRQSLRFEVDSQLLAGVRIVAGDWLLGCNLRDELAGMTELTHAG
jgi:F-type H+-transporting ATPase subunit b